MEGEVGLKDLYFLQEKSGKNYIRMDEVRNLSREKKIHQAEVYGVATFYTMLSVKPRGKHIIRVCRSISCHIGGSGKILEALKRILNIDIGQTTEDGIFTLEESSCLGLCDIAPAMMIDDEVFGNLTVDKIEGILKKFKESKVR